MSPKAQKTASEALSAAVLRMLRPLVRMMLRYGIPYGAFADLAKRVYVEVARDDFTITGRKQTQSRISVITGLSRKEVKRVSELPRPDDDGGNDRYNRAARVIGGWVRDADYQDAQGHPAPLAIEGPEPSFAGLARRHSGDIPPRAILDELERVQAIAVDEDDRVHLLSRAYVPASGEVDKLAILGSDVHDLIATIEHNLEANPRDTFFQRKVAYDNLPEQAMQPLRQLAAQRAQGLLEQLDAWMSKRDRDATPGAEGSGRKRASVGIYYYEEDYDEAEPAASSDDTEDPS